MANPVILTVYNNQIDPDFPSYQKQVIEKVNKSKIPFLCQQSDIWNSYPNLSHGDMLNLELRYLINERKYDTFILIDVDCIPLNYHVLDMVVDVADSGKIIGNAQCYSKGLTYVAPSFVCFSKQIFLQLLCPSLSSYPWQEKTNDKFALDAGEGLSHAARNNNIDLVFFTPKTVLQIQPNWHIGDQNKKLGIGTTFEYEGEEVTFHNFCSRYNHHDYNTFFVDKAKSVLNQKFELSY